MSYFSRDDHKQLLSLTMGGDTTALERLYKRMVNLNREIYPRLKTQNIDLHPVPGIPGGVSQVTAASPVHANALTLTYMRSESVARDVEGFMGRDALSEAEAIEAHRHPVIELRLSPDYFAVEFIISPSAWYDQQNFVGKMSIQQHKARFFELLRQLHADFSLGFWNGIQLNEMHLSTEQLPPAHVIYEYIDTFADRRDWLRLGRWYEAGADQLAEYQIVDELVERIRELNAMYEFAAWSGSNNFHNFYRKMIARS